jgi:hypothetical protein
MNNNKKDDISRTIIIIDEDIIKGKQKEEGEITGDRITNAGDKMEEGINPRDADHECTGRANKKHEIESINEVILKTKAEEGREVEHRGIRGKANPHHNVSRTATLKEAMEVDWEAIGGLRTNISELEIKEEMWTNAGKIERIAASGQVNGGTFGSAHKNKIIRNKKAVGEVKALVKRITNEMGISRTTRGDGWNIAEIGIDNREARLWLRDLARGKTLTAPGTEKLEDDTNQDSGPPGILGEQAAFRILQDACTTKKITFKATGKKTE